MFYCRIPSADIECKGTTKILNYQILDKKMQKLFFLRSLFFAFSSLECSH